MRSAMPPETMVAEVAQNTLWKKKNVRVHMPSSVVGSLPLRQNRFVPMMPLRESPNMRPKPSTKKQMAPTPKSAKFFIVMLAAFLARVRPHSTRAKPGCMNMTSMAPTMVQTVSTALLGVYSGAFSAASARQGTVSTAARASRAMTHFLLRLKYDVKSMINSFSL